ncbi:MAG: SpoIIE family protein phosphatase [Cyclobacteriaceae bacterium]
MKNRVKELYGNLEVYGTYTKEQNQLYLSKDDTTRVITSRLEEICRELLDSDANHVVIELEENKSFIGFYPHSQRSIILLAGGPIDCFPMLHALLINDECTERTISFEEENVRKSFLRSSELLSQLLPVNDTLEPFFDDYFIYYRPLYQIGGDFYWFEQNDDKIMIILGDCTGHGVAAALVGIAMLQMVRSRFSHSEKELHESLYDFYDDLDAYHEKYESDEMVDLELGIVVYDKSKGTLDFTGSGINLHYYDGAELKLLKTRRTQVVKKELVHVKLNVKEGQKFFLHSDGVIDQFDNQNKRKLGRMGLQTILEEQCKGLSEFQFIKHVNAFKGQTEQIDDSTFLAFSL